VVRARLSHSRDRATHLSCHEVFYRAPDHETPAKIMVSHKSTCNEARK
jgi:hypothetical protein